MIFPRAKKSSQLSSTRTASRGAAMVEFALILPFLVMFLFCMLEFGRASQQITWVQNATYNAAIMGAHTPDSPSTVVDERANSMLVLVQAQSAVLNRHHLNLPDANIIAAVEPDLVTGRTTLRVEASGQLPMFWRWLPIGVTGRIVGPVLVGNTPIIPAAVLQQWVNDPNGSFRHCDGTIQATPESATTCL